MRYLIQILTFVSAVALLSGIAAAHSVLTGSSPPERRCTAAGAAGDSALVQRGDRATLFQRDSDP